MSGINRIATKREQIRNPQSDKPTNREVWFKDGDQAFLSPVATCTHLKMQSLGGLIV